MPIPPFTINGVLPPYIGPNGPGGQAQDMSPYEVTSVEVAATLGTTNVRRNILRGWLQHRRDLRQLGSAIGFQWLDGSFVEDKEPRDLDIVTFVHRPPGIGSGLELHQFMIANPAQFRRGIVKATYNLDAFFVDLDGSGPGIVNATRYFNGLFSHRRDDALWKGMLQVRIDTDVEDDAALDLLDAHDAAEPAEEATP